jgi:hypothetical protein
MKAKPTEKKLTIWSGRLLIVKVLCLLVVIPLSIPVAGWFVEALVWRFLLCRINGINLMGGLIEAFAMSIALGSFAACINLLLAVVKDGLKVLRKIPLDKIGQRKASGVKDWDDIYKTLPGFRSLVHHFVVNTVALATLSRLQPVRLHFDGAFELLLSAGILSASWIFCMTTISIFVFAFLLRRQKTRAATGNAVL